MRLYLLAAVDAVLAEDRRAASGHPDASQRVAVHLVLLDHALALLVLEHRQRGNGPSVSSGRPSSASLAVHSPRRFLRAARRGSCCAVQ